MRIDERLELARAVYRRAVALAREEATAATWRRALAASRYLDAALRAHDRGLRRALEATSGRPATAPPGVRRGGHRGGHRARAGVDRREPGRDPAAVAVAAHLDAWNALHAELARARGLVARARELRDRSRALRAELAKVVQALRRNAPTGRAATSAGG